MRKNDLQSLRLLFSSTSPKIRPASTKSPFRKNDYVPKYTKENRYQPPIFYRPTPLWTMICLFQNKTSIWQYLKLRRREKVRYKIYSLAETQKHLFTFLVVLEWLVHSILGALMEELFTMWKKICFNLIFTLCMMNHVIISQILSILDGR